MAKRTKTEVIISRSIFEGKIDTIAQLQVAVQTLAAERDSRIEAILQHYNTQIKAHDTVGQTHDLPSGSWGARTAF